MPDLAHLLHRLLDTPAPLLDPLGNGVVLPALVGDVLQPLAAALKPADLLPFGEAKADANWRRCVALACWLLADSSFAGQAVGQQALAWLLGPLRALAAAVTSARFVDDEDHREEFVRALLLGLELLPEGETQEQALDRLMAVSTTERKRLQEAARATQRKREELERERRVREELERRAQEEAAAKASRE